MVSTRLYFAGGGPCVKAMIVDAQLEDVKPAMHTSPLAEVG